MEIESMNNFWETGLERGLSKTVWGVSFWGVGGRGLSKEPFIWFICFSVWFFWTFGRPNLLLIHSFFRSYIHFSSESLLLLFIFLSN